MWAVIQSTIAVIAKFVTGDVPLSTFNTIQFFSAFVFMFLYIFSTYESSELECIVHAKDSRETVTSFSYMQGLFVLEGHPVEKVEIAYYIWVPHVMMGCFLSVFAGGLIYKYVLWGDLLPCFLNELKEAIKVDNSEAKLHLKNLITKSRIKADSKDWMYSILALELIHLIIPCLQIYCLDKLLSGKFHFLGFNINNRDYLDTVFPRKAKCDFSQIGPSGTLENLDILSALTSSPVNEKIFLCASWWLMSLVVISTAGLIWRILTLIFYKAHSFNKFVWMNNKVSKSKQNMHCILTILSNVNSFPDWMYIHFAARNLDFKALSHFLENLSNSYITMEEMEEVKIQMDNGVVETGQRGGHVDNRENNGNISLNDNTQTRGDFLESATMENKSRVPERTKKIYHEFLSRRPKVKHTPSNDRSRNYMDPSVEPASGYRHPDPSRQPIH